MRSPNLYYKVNQSWVFFWSALILKIPCGFSLSNRAWHGLHIRQMCARSAYCRGPWGGIKGYRSFLLQLQRNSSVQKIRSLNTGGKQKKNLGHGNVGFEKYSRYNKSIWQVFCMCFQEKRRPKVFVARNQNVRLDLHIF